MCCEEAMAVNLERQLLYTFVIISDLEKIVGYTVGADKFAPSCPLGLLRTHPLPCPLPRSGGRRLAWSTCMRDFTLPPLSNQGLKKVATNSLKLKKM